MGSQYPPPPPSYPPPQQPPPPGQQLQQPWTAQQVQTAYLAQPRRRPVWPWLLGGCAAIALVGVVGVVVALVLLGRAVSSGALNCTPTDFPSYPGETVQGAYTYQGTSYSSCSTTLDVPADRATATDFYSGHLSSGDWKLTAADPPNGFLRFQNQSHPKVHGTVEMTDRGSHTQVKIEIVTDR